MVSNNIVRLLQSSLGNPCENGLPVMNYLTKLVLGLLIWCLLYGILGSDVTLQGPLFCLMALGVCSHATGWLVSLIHLPPLIGMLLCGLLMQYAGFYHITEPYSKVVSVIRNAALVMILLKAGLGLKPSELKNLSFTIARLSVLPCMSEMVAVAVAARFFMNMPWMWGLLLGSVLSALSPAVVVPSLLAFKKEGYGEDKGIAALVVASSSIDDIISISAFGILLEMVFTDNLEESLMRGPIEGALGLGIGFCWGLICACVPHRKEEHLVWKRTLMVGVGSLVAVVLSSTYGYEASGPLAVIILSFVAQLCWRWQGWMVTDNPVGDLVTAMWFTIQPMLFGLIGTEIKLETIQPSLIFSSSQVLFFGLAIRMLSCSLALIGANLNWKENLFINLAWLPKATVQATLGPVALNKAMSMDHAEDIIAYSSTILTVAVMAIIITAPIGAISIAFGGRKLLNKPKEVQTCEEKECDMADITI